MLKVLNKSWFGLHQPLLLAIANTREGRDLFGIDECLPEIKMLTPSSLTVTLEGNKYLSQFYPVNKYARAIDRNLIEIADYSRAFQYLPVVAGGETTVFNPDAFAPPPGAGDDSIDGDCEQNGSNVTFASLVGGGGSASTDTSAFRAFVVIKADTTANRYTQLRRAFYLYDTSPLSDSASIQSARHGVHVTTTGQKQLNSGSHDSSRLVLVSSNPASNTALVSGDFDSVGSSSFGQGATQSSLDSNSWNYISLNASGLANISKTGISKFALRWKWDFLNSTTGITWASNGTQSINGYFADESGREPILEVTWIIGIQLSGGLTGGGVLLAIAERLWELSGNLVGAGDIVGNADVPAFIDLSGELTGAGDLLAVGGGIIDVSGELTGAGEITAIGSTYVDMSGSLTGAGDLVHAEFLGPQIYLVGSM